MNAVQFPNMLYNNKTNIVKDKDATYQNLVYLLLSMKQELFGDPYYGVNLRKLMFERNNAILRDLVIDDILTSISVFMPQIVVKRKDIRVESDNTRVIVNIKAQNMIDFSFSDYSINLINLEELE